MFVPPQARISLGLTGDDGDWIYLRASNRIGLPPFTSKAQVEGPFSVFP